MPVNKIWISAHSDLPAGVTTVQEICAFWKRILDEREYQPVDLILFPECCSRPRGLPKELTYQLSDESYLPLLEMLSVEARKRRCYIAFSAHVPPAVAGDRRNAVTLIDRSGQICAQYFKVAPTRDEISLRQIKPGDGPVIAECDFGRVGMFLCFDINFPELMLAYRSLHPVLMLFASACDGTIMRSHWAYMCRCHLLSAIGLGVCTVLDPAGSVLAQSTNYRSYVRAQINLDCCNVPLGYPWKDIHDLQRKYPDRFVVDVPAGLSTGVAYSYDPDRSVSSFLEEAGIPVLDDYYNEMRKTYHDLGVPLF